MINIIGKGISEKYFFDFSWGFTFFSAGYFCFEKIFSSLFNEFNKLNIIFLKDL